MVSPSTQTRSNLNLQPATLAQLAVLERSLSLSRYAIVASPAATPSDSPVLALGGGCHGGRTTPGPFAKEICGEVRYFCKRLGEKSHAKTAKNVHVLAHPINV